MDDALKLDSTDELLAMFATHEHFCKAMIDGYAVIDRFGRVIKCNQLFAVLTGMKSKQILKTSSLDEILSLTVSGGDLSAAKILENLAPTRIDEVEGFASGGVDVNLIIGIYPFVKNKQTLGAFVLFRDVTAERDLQFKYVDKAAKSITDPLTGLYNRGFLDEYLQNRMERLSDLSIPPSERRFSIIMTDIDHFKRCNDTYGHLAGDYIIQEIAEVLQDESRSTDIVCRYGGEEFVLILPSSDLEGAAIAADKVRAVVENRTFEFEGQEIPVTVSLGVTSIKAGQLSADKAIAQADAALYYSKQKGRNQVSCYIGEGRIRLSKEIDGFWSNLPHLPDSTD